VHWPVIFGKLELDPKASEIASLSGLPVIQDLTGNNCVPDYRLA
jgi:hypothetical protein